ncbi:MULTISPECIES: DUF413 domain-containing protein [Cellvibrio]|jgi:uncharacterized protein YifE (UPF0438 family)|uniref:Macrodomain Ori protein n=1 Tax=Cellvibrio fibrivorans TaxID=126350 RepID=A0ABU1US75_9GAMM|nr:DUF413 domain-containing protein [Cellvibrio fibrivorans]MDR7088035.1 uncharacterized protein YifE (UPF0438 family) [Cellvibrio fibrivorans]
MLPRDHYLKQTFQDTVNFPDGFEKGGLSDIQARLIRKQGVLVNALTMDEVSDPTPDDLHILKVIANQSAPKSPIEQAWTKYLSIVKARQASAPAKSSKTKAKPKPAEPAAAEPAATDPEAKPAKAKAAKKTAKTE